MQAAHHLFRPEIQSFDERSTDLRTFDLEIPAHVRKRLWRVLVSLVHGDLGEIARVSAFVSRGKHLFMIMYTYSKSYWEETRKTKDKLVFSIATDMVFHDLIIFI